MTSSRPARLAMLSLLAIFLCFNFFSFPVLAASEGFSFVEFSFAFVLGLSLPIFLMVFIIKPISVIKKHLPLLLTMALFGLLLSINYLPQEHVFTGLIFSSLMVQISGYWSINYHLADEALNPKVMVKNIVFGVLFALFITLLWSTIVSSKIAWLIFCSLQTLIVLAYIWLMRHSSQEINVRSISLLVVNVIFALGIYFWLTGEIAINALVVISVIMYLVVMANGCWHLVIGLVAKDNHQSPLTQFPIRITHDPVTNLPNYQYALSFLEHSIKINLSARYAAIVFKPMNFQQVNRALGHHNSDILLLQLAYSLQKSITDNDDLLNFSSPELPVRLARLQGLHFLAVMDVSQSKHNDEIIIEQLCKALAIAVPGPMSFKSFSSAFKLVFGVAYVGKDTNNVSEVIACAEDALLQAENQQKLLSFFNQELSIFNQQQLQKMEQLKHAIQQDTLQWNLHPQVALNSKIIIGFELEVNWQRQDNEQLNLADMMAIAEQSGDDYALSRQMISQAFKSLVKVQEMDVPVQLAIKITSASLLEPDLIDYIEHQSDVYGVSCQYLLVEIKEEILLMASPQAKASIDQLRALGVEIVIDEFSGSYEALRYIRKLAVSGIKIDCNSLAKATAGSPDKAILNTLITLTRKMDLPLIGTNINTQAIEKMYLALGGEYGQGQHYSTGISLDKLPHWLAAWHKQYAESS